jgi:hypothetical protein
MNMKKLSLALAVFAASVVPTRATVTTGSAGNPINIMPVIPAAAGNMTCANVAVTTFTATQVMAARTSAIRTGLFIINASTVPMNGGTTRAPDVIWNANSGMSANVGSSSYAATPGVLLHPKPSVLGQASTVGSNDQSRLDGSGVPSGAIYAVAESSNATTNVQATVTACEWY